MGTDYIGVGGIGIEFTEDLVNSAIEKGIFTEEEWEEDYYCCMELIEIPFRDAGNLYIDRSKYYLMVEGKTLSEVIENTDKFIEIVNTKLGKKLDLDDLKVISDILIC